MALSFDLNLRILLADKFIKQYRVTQKIVSRLAKHELYYIVVSFILV
jgi:hypothetical protein